MYILRLGLFYPVTATTVVCCILMEILCIVATFDLSNGAPPLDPAGGLPPDLSLLLCPLPQ